MLSSEEAYRARDPPTGTLPPSFDYTHTHDMFSLARFVRDGARAARAGDGRLHGLRLQRASFVDAQHLIASGVCDAAVVGGADSLCRMTLHGFAALDLISPVAVPALRCGARRHLHRRGGRICPAGARGRRARPARLRREQRRLSHVRAASARRAARSRAMQRRIAIARACARREIDYVNLHGTGTRANDAMEDLAMVEVFGTATPCSSTKGWTGHALGAAGILEAVIAGLCIRSWPDAGLPQCDCSGSDVPRASGRRQRGASSPPGHEQCIRLRRHQLQPDLRYRSLMRGIRPGVSVWGPGLPGWPASRPVLAGVQARRRTEPARRPAPACCRRPSAAVPASPCAWR